jgi:hypothetical protein
VLGDAVRVVDAFAAGAVGAEVVVAKVDTTVVKPEAAPETDTVTDAVTGPSQSQWSPWGSQP